MPLNIDTFMAAATATVVMQMEPQSTRLSWGQYLIARAGVASLKSLIPSVFYSAADLLIWTLSVGQLMYGFMIRPESLSPSYVRYMGRASLADAETRREMVAVCQGCQEGQLCKTLHTGEGCLYHIGKVYLNAFGVGFPICFVNYVIPGLLFAQRYLRAALNQA